MRPKGSSLLQRYAPSSNSTSLTYSCLLQSLLNPFSEDTIHISVRHLLQVVAKRGWSCAAVFHVMHYATNASHYVAILDTGHPICDCMMGTNLGLPCRHFIPSFERRVPQSSSTWVFSTAGKLSVPSVLMDTNRRACFSRQVADRSHARCHDHPSCHDRTSQIDSS
jgi:hypothetical protein